MLFRVVCSWCDETFSCKDNNFVNNCKNCKLFGSKNCELVSRKFETLNGMCQKCFDKMFEKGGR